ncbi:heme ABC exporter ATP-binding protein CcmA [Oceanibaculum pacificum]|uniref:Cytochrome C biogenesis protein CcmA n=1 Tax=Oceanibaculum pacificum TaxID=580166 RepID=A0A154WAE8_9PROT|nr:heme ABC exporter ATP-binding protein CcmA [Oceanibaculum pacificum]KZD10492.1 cytochrome C biogenesis protein CcmA [Oceanibaculum pacificum]
MNDFSGIGLACRRGDRLVFRHLDFTLPAGGALVLRGPNGSGKSSLLRLMAGLLPPAAGTLAWDGAPIAQDRELHRERVQYVGHLDAVKPALTVRENLRFWAGMREALDDQAAAEALARFGIAHLADAPGRFLSAGQKRRLALARLLATGSDLWLLDEPTVALDVATIAVLEDVIAGFRAQGGRVVVSTHSPIDLPGAVLLDMAGYAAPRLTAEELL